MSQAENTSHSKSGGHHTLVGGSVVPKPLQFALRAHGTPIPTRTASGAFGPLASALV